MFQLITAWSLSPRNGCNVFAKRALSLSPRAAVRLSCNLHLPVVSPFVAPQVANEFRKPAKAVHEDLHRLLLQVRVS